MRLMMYILSYLPILITVAVIMNLIDHPGNSFHSDAQKVRKSERRVRAGSER